jgi:predicted phage terminase large subunit-like protein
LELLKRRKARAGLIPFTEYTNHAYEPAPPHSEIAEKLEAVERGEIDRLMIFMPPRHGKSELASRRFPAWYMGRNPQKQIIAASYNSDLASDFGREVRNIIRTNEFSRLFNVKLAEDSRAAGRWNTDAGGAYVAAGVGTAVTGRGAHILLIDDPVKDREEAESELRRDTIWNWYTSTAYTRLMPGGSVILIQCMTGDTPVLMETGSEKPLRDIRAGDRVATYEDGKITSSVVRNWINQGPDRVFEIRMKSGITVKANARHPFLVDDGGELKWLRTASLKKGSVILKATGANGRALAAHRKDATSPPSARACARHTTTSTSGKRALDRLQSILGRGVRRISVIATELTCQTMSAFSQSRAAFAQFASSLLQSGTPALIGTTSSASITATTARRSGAFSATTATLLSDTARPNKSCSQPPNTYEIARDEVVEVVEAGIEDVFDIQVDRTENFIANGLVSHNTRWHEDDLGGRLLEAEGNGGDQWVKVNLPALHDGQALWPERYDVDALKRIKAAIGPRDFEALYQQNPTPDDGTFFLRDWFKRHDEAPKLGHVYITSDYAVTEDGGDWTAHLVWNYHEDTLTLIDGWTGQTSADVWIEELLRLFKQHRPLCYFGEAGVIVKAVKPMLTRRMNELRVFARTEWIPSISDKPTRARAFQARAAMGKVSLPKSDLGEKVLNQLLSFPAGKHDDLVDTCALMGMVIDMAHPGFTPAAPQPLTRPRDYRPAAKADNWRVL